MEIVEIHKYYAIFNNFSFETNTICDAICRSSCSCIRIALAQQTRNTSTHNYFIVILLDVNYEELQMERDTATLITTHIIQHWFV